MTSSGKREQCDQSGSLQLALMLACLLMMTKGRLAMSARHMPLAVQKQRHSAQHGGAVMKWIIHACGLFDRAWPNYRGAEHMIVREGKTRTCIVAGVTARTPH